MKIRKIPIYRIRPATGLGHGWWECVPTYMELRGFGRSPYEAYQRCCVLNKVPYVR